MTPYKRPKLSIDLYISSYLIVLIRNRRLAEDKVEADNSHTHPPMGYLPHSSGIPGCPKAKERKNKLLTYRDHNPARPESPLVYKSLSNLLEQSISINNLASRRKCRYN